MSKKRPVALRGHVAGIAGVVLAAGTLAACGVAKPGSGATTVASTVTTAAAGPCAGGKAGRPSPIPLIAQPPPGSLIVGGDLAGVAAESTSNVWAVGTTGLTNPVSMHCNGRTWTQVLTPAGDRPDVSPGSFSALAVVSGQDIWAVGVAAGQTLIEHWDGRAWSRVPSPQPGGGIFLSGVAAVSASDVWAVGTTSGERGVILHWNGVAWTLVPSPVPAGSRSAPVIGSQLYSVAASSPRDVWAVGEIDIQSAGASTRPLIEHWNGTAWALVPSPAIHSAGTLMGVSASAPDSAWAVGGRAGGAGLTEHWNGRSWTVAPSPDLAGPGELHAVAAASASSAWAVGGFFCPGRGPVTVTEHWNGQSWTFVPSPALGMLTGVTVTSPDNVWAVGSWSGGSTAVIEHWDGTAWTWPPGFCASPSGPGCLAPGTSSSTPVPPNTYVVPSATG
jgi:hypothetical protein